MAIRSGVSCLSHLTKQTIGWQREGAEGIGQIQVYLGTVSPVLPRRLDQTVFVYRVTRRARVPFHLHWFTIAGFQVQVTSYFQTPWLLPSAASMLTAGLLLDVDSNVGKSVYKLLMNPSMLFQ